MGEVLEVTECSVARVSIKENTKRRIFAESAGYCARTACHLPLFPDDVNDIHFAELAHIIAASTGGPRDVDPSVMNAIERSEADNLVLLCANCHSIIDKDEKTYPAEKVLSWKRNHRNSLDAAFGTRKFETRKAARASFVKYCERNAASFRLHGPESADAAALGNSRAARWQRHVLSVIIPNNRSMLHLAEMNRELLTEHEGDTLGEFTVHVQDLEMRHLWNDWTTGGLRFPGDFAKLFEGDDDD